MRNIGSKSEIKVKIYYGLSTFRNNILHKIFYLPTNISLTRKIMTYYFVVAHKMIYDPS